jgi:hypothetical protein
VFKYLPSLVTLVFWARSLRGEITTSYLKFGLDLFDNEAVFWIFAKSKNRKSPSHETNLLDIDTARITLRKLYSSSKTSVCYYYKSYVM